MGIIRVVRWPYSLAGLLVLNISLGLISSAYAQVRYQDENIDYETTSAIFMGHDADDLRRYQTKPQAKSGVNSQTEALDGETAAIPPFPLNRVKPPVAVPNNLVGRWTVRHVRTPKNVLRKMSQLLPNPAVLTLRQDGQFTMTAGCTQNLGTLRWDEGRLSLGMVLSEDNQCNASQKQLEEHILDILDRVSQLDQKAANKVSFQDEKGRDLITLSRVD
ncbi:MAG: META domain-containing protein [Cohaesibacter sp.]|nr:META domain-containing protein [Cohaesibacter sp.]